MVFTEMMALVKSHYSFDDYDLEMELHKMLHVWEPIKGFPRYHRHRMSHVIKSDRGVLKPNKRGQIRMYSEDKVKWLQQGDLEYHERCDDRYYSNIEIELQHNNWD